MFFSRPTAVVVLGLSSLATAMPAAADTKWYQGGTLHHATLAEWKRGGDSDRLATAADFAASLPYVQKKMKGERSMDALLPYAYGLLRCIDEASKVKASVARKQATAETAAVCAILMDWT